MIIIILIIILIYNNINHNKQFECYEACVLKKQILTRKKSVSVLFLNKTISKEKRIQFPFCIYLFFFKLQFNFKF